MVDAIESRTKNALTPLDPDPEAELLRQDYLFKDQFLYEKRQGEIIYSGLRPDKQGIYEVTPDQVAQQIIIESDLGITTNTKEYFSLKRKAPEIITLLNSEHQKLVYGDWNIDITSCIGTSFEEYWPQYIEEMERSGLREQTIRDKQATFAKWKELMGSVSLSGLNKATARAFKEYLSKLPSNVSKKYAHMAVKDVLTLNIPLEKRMRPRTIKGYLSDLRSYVTWLKNEGLFLKDNPFDGISVADKQHLKDKRNSLSEDQLVKLFSCPIFTGCAGHKQTDRNKSGELIIKDSRYWTPLIAIFTGARLNEILQLYRSDITESKGVWYFDFNDRGADKSLKNRSSCRKVPIHSFLIRLGFLVYISGLHPEEHRIFPDTSIGSNGKYSDPYSKKFAYLLKKLGIKTDSKCCFHSIRHTVIDQFRIDTRVAREVAEAITGHTDGSTHSQYGSRQFSLETLQEAIEELSYPYLERILFKP